jgi:hypothetical protein
VTNKPSAPVVGFNHNVKYGERVYHVQTEDSGLPHAHYITHLFVGGNIIASMKSSYSEHAELPDLQKIVRALMESQHKRMLKRLIAGEFRDQAARLDAQHYEPGVLADGTNTASYVNTDAGSGHSSPSPRPGAPSRTPPSGPFAPRAPAQPASSSPQPFRAPQQPPEPLRPAAHQIQPLRAAPQTAPFRPAPQPAPPQRTATAPPPRAVTPPPPRIPGQPLPAVTRGPATSHKPSAPPRMTPLAPPPRPKVAAEPKPSVFSDGLAEMPHEDLPTLFAEELISEKSLDEVILAFLSADLDPPK